jgi:hypothetical protein
MQCNSDNEPAAKKVKDVNKLSDVCYNTIRFLSAVYKFYLFKYEIVLAIFILFYSWQATVH